MLPGEVETQEENVVWDSQKCLAPGVCGLTASLGMSMGLGVWSPCYGAVCSGRELRAGSGAIWGGRLWGNSVCVELGIREGSSLGAQTARACSGLGMGSGRGRAWVWI